MSISFKAAPTLAAFMKSDAFGRLVAGPVGSGKTTACVLEGLRRSIMQAPGEDGLRYTRFAVVRQTLKQLKDTVLKECSSWLGGLGEWKVSDNTFYLNFDRVRSEWVFIPLENADDQARLLSMQLTGAWLSECIEMDFSVLAPISGRLGRYPSASRGVPSWYGMFADTNFPTELTPWWKLMEEPPPEWEIFRQPSGISPEAENLCHLLQTEETRKLPEDHPARLAQGRKYYERLLSINADNPDWIKRYVYAEYGDDPSGQAVFKNTFKASFHTSDSTEVIPGYPIIVGQDFGRNPWSLIGQMDHRGRLNILEEVRGTNVGLEKHVYENLRPRLAKYLSHRIVLVGDPSGAYKGQITEESCMDALKRLGLPAFPAPTNDLEPRLRSVEAMLARQVDGGPALVINRQNCPMLVRAMSGGYRFTKTKQGGLRSVPEKNDAEGFSHVCDDLQYICLVCHGGLIHEYAQRLAPRVPQKRRFSSAAWT